MPLIGQGGLVLLSEDDVERIHRETDGLDLDRDWVIVPLNCAPEGLERVLPDGKILLRAPGGMAFEAWLGGLPGRLVEIGLGRTRRREVRGGSAR